MTDVRKEALLRANRVLQHKVDQAVWDALYEPSREGMTDKAVAEGAPIIGVYIKHRGIFLTPWQWLRVGVCALWRRLVPRDSAHEIGWTGKMVCSKASLSSVLVERPRP